MRGCCGLLRLSQPELGAEHTIPDPQPGSTLESSDTKVALMRCVLTRDSNSTYHPALVVLYELVS